MGNESHETGQGKMNKKDKKKTRWSLRSIFMHTDGMDKCLMFLGLIGAVGDGLSTPLVLFVSSKLMNEIGTSSSLDLNVFRDNINKVSINCFA